MRKQILELIIKFGSVESLKKEICNTLEELTKDGYAEGNIHQILHWSKMLYKLKKEY